MIKAEELRIGNLVLWNPNLNVHTTIPSMLVEVTSIGRDRIGYVSPSVENRVEAFEDDKVESDAPQRPLAEFEPILLTPELFAKCGFIKGEKGSFKVMLFGEEAAGYVVYWGEEWLCHIIYLHELQNLHFLLQGEELSLDQGNLLYTGLLK